MMIQLKSAAGQKKDFPLAVAERLLSMPKAAWSLAGSDYKFVDGSIVKNKTTTTKKAKSESTEEKSKD